MGDLTKHFENEINIALSYIDNSELKFSDPNEVCNLKHGFGKNGVYTREITMPKGTLAVGKVHKKDHVVFLTKGKILVASKYGKEEYNAPCYAICKAGIQRVVLALEETTWVNVHYAEGNTIEEIENELVCDTEKEYKQWLLLSQEQLQQSEQ